MIFQLAFLSDTGSYAFNKCMRPLGIDFHIYLVAISIKWITTGLYHIWEYVIGLGGHVLASKISKDTCPQLLSLGETRTGRSALTLGRCI